MAEQCDSEIPLGVTLAVSLLFNVILIGTVTSRVPTHTQQQEPIGRSLLEDGDVTVLELRDMRPQPPAEGNTGE